MAGSRLTRLAKTGLWLQRIVNAIMTNVQIEIPIPINVPPRGTGAPARRNRLSGIIDRLKGPVTPIVKQGIPSHICDKNVVESIIVEVRDRDTLSISTLVDPRACRHLFKLTLAPILEQTVDRLIGEINRCRVSPLNEIQIGLTIQIIIEPSRAAPCRFDHQGLTASPVFIAEMDSRIRHFH